MIDAIRARKYLQFILLVFVFLFLCTIIGPSETNWLWRLPPLLKELPLIINNAVDFMMFEWWPIEVYDAEIEEYEQKPLLREITRGVSGVVLFLIEFVREVLLGGVKTIVTFSGWDWATENQWARWPALPWTVVAGGAAILGYALSGIGLAAFAGLSLVYIAVFGQWEPSMQTLSFVLIAAPVAIFLGLLLGVWGYKSKRVEAILCLLYTSPSPRDQRGSRMPSSA